MRTTNEALIHKLLCRMAALVEQEADRRGVHAMDFVEVVADQIVGKALSMIETEPKE